MGETMETENAAFWLPTHFLTDDDFLVSDDQKQLKKEPNPPLKSFDLFSNGFDPFGSSLDSPVSSTETDKDNDENDDDEFLAELTRQLAHSTLQDTHLKSHPTHNYTHNNNNEKPWMFSTSPQSTLSGFGPWSNRSGFTSNGSPNGPSQVPSPPLSPPGPKNDAAWELLYEAAGQVARLKMNAIAARMNQQQNRGLLGVPRNPSSLSTTNKSHQFNNFYDFPPTNQFEQQVKRQGSAMWGQGGRLQQEREREDWYCQTHQHNHQQRRSCGGGHGGALGLPQSAWPPLKGQGQPQPPRHLHNHRGGAPAPAAMRAMFLGPSSGPGPAVKRQSTGTGVFLPRRCGSGSTHHHQPEPRKKPTGCSTVLLPTRVVHALNLDLEEMNNGANLNSQSRFGSGHVTDHEIAMARRNALLSQQRRSLRQEGATMVGQDIRLPSDWTY